MVGATSKPFAALAACAAIALAACGGGSSNGPQGAVDSTTRAVYNDDANGVTQNFDDALRNQFTRAEMGIMSDQMHRLGDYRGLQFTGSDATKNEYTYRAAFANGSMRVVVRLDPDGKFAAYRVFPT